MYRNTMQNIKTRISKSSTTDKQSSAHVNTNIIVAIYPNQNGMGYVICEHPNDILKYGIGKFKQLSPTNYVKRLAKFIKHYRPDVIVLKGYNAQTNTIGKRVKKVIDSLETEAIKRELNVFRYRRSDIAKVFSTFGESNKYGISRTLAKWYPELRRYLVPIRTFMEPEHYHMGIFDAFALMYTHSALTGLISEPHEN